MGCYSFSFIPTFLNTHANFAFVSVISSEQLQSYAIQLKEEIALLRDAGLAATLTEDVQRILTSSVFVFGLEHFSM